MTELERGRQAARDFLAKQPSQHEISMNYGYSKAAPDHTPFDDGWQEILRERLKQ